MKTKLTFLVLLLFLCTSPRLSAQGISGLTELNAAPDPNDFIEVLDASDTTMAGSGTNKKNKISKLFTSPTFITPTLGVASATSLNSLTFTTSTGTFTLTNGKTLSVSNTITLAGTDGTTMTFPATSATLARTDAANTFTGTQTIGALVATTVNGNTFTTGTGTLTIAAGKTFTASNTLTLTATDSSTVAFGAGGTVAYIGAANAWADNVRQTFNPGADAAGVNVGAQASDPGTPSNGDVYYDLDDHLLRARINGAWVNLGAGGGLASADIDTSAELDTIVGDDTGSGALVFATSPTIDGATLTGTTTASTLNADTGSVTTFRVLDSVDQSHGLSFVVGSNLTADRNLTITTGDAARTITLNGNPTLNDWFDQSVKQAATPTFAGATLSSGTTTLGTTAVNGTATLAENTSIALDPAGSADGKYSGVTIAGTAGAALSFGDLVVLDVTDSRWELADANSAAAADGDARGNIGICVLAAAADGDPTVIMLCGTVRADAAFPALTVNGTVHISETAGDVTSTSPTTEDAVIRALGTALTADEIFFNPQSGFITYDAP